MYTEFYGLSGFPFQLTPDPRFFFDSTVHRRAVAHLDFGLSQGEGFIVITGEVGAGKTTILERLLATVGTDRFVAAKLVSTNLGADDVLRAVASAFRIEFEGCDKASLLRRIEDFLASNHARGLRALLLVDEAQNLTHRALEELRMLSNFQVGARVPLQSILLGQPQLKRLLAAPDLEQFRQRIVASYHLGPMGAGETRAYVRHRLATVGWRDDPAFTDDAFAGIHAQTGGVPRRINLFCSRLLLHAFLDERHRIDAETVSEVGEDLRRETNDVLDGAGGAPAAVSQAPLGEDRLERLERAVDRLGRAVAVLAEGRG